MSDPEEKTPEAGEQAPGTASEAEAAPQARTSGDTVDGDSPTGPTTRGGTGPASGRPWLAIVALVVALLAGGVAYLAWQESAEREARVATAQEALDVGLADARTRLAALEAEVEKRFDANAQQLAEQQAALERQREFAEQAYQTLREEVGQDRNRWVLAEIEYLLRVAAHRLALAGDIRAAVVALQTADSRLRDLGDPAWLDVRAQIAEEIAALRAVPDVDVEGLALSLRSLARRSETLPVLGARYRAGDPRAAAAGEAGEGARGENWREALSVAWNEIRQLVEVRRNDQPVEPMLAPELEYFLYQNLRLQLDAARLALLRGEAPLYTESLRSARDWVATYFEPDHASTRAMLEELDRLLAAEIDPPLPEVGEALRTLRDTPAYREARGAAS